MLRNFLVFAVVMLSSCGMDVGAAASFEEPPGVRDRVSFSTVAHMSGCLGESLGFRSDAEASFVDGEYEIIAELSSTRLIMLMVNPTFLSIQGCEGPVYGDWDFDDYANETAVQVEEDAVHFEGVWYDEDGEVAHHVRGFALR